MPCIHLANVRRIYETFNACYRTFRIDYHLSLNRRCGRFAALDFDIITPATFIAGVLILRHNPLGYLVAFALLIREVILTPLL